MDIASITFENSLRIDRPYKANALGAYQEAIEAAEARVTYKRVKLEPVIVEPSHPSGELLLMFQMQNIGNTDIDLLHLEI